MDDNQVTQNSNQEVVKQEDKPIASFSGINFKSLVELKAWGNEIVRQGFTPLKTGEAVVAAIMMGKELGLDPMVSVNNIYPINNKATLGIHIISALLTKAGIVTEIVRDYEACVPFCLKGDDGKVYLGEDGKQNPIVLRIGFYDEPAREGEIRSKSVVDWRTVVKMTRQIKLPNGDYKEISMQGSYGTADAVTAGLSVKDNWQKSPKQMVRSRAIAIVARLIADDILNGIYETSEMLDTTNIPYVVNEEGRVTIIQQEVKTEKQEVSNLSSVENATIIEEVK